MHNITRNFEFVKYFTKCAQNPDGDEIFPIPFIEDIDGRTALHVSLDTERGHNSRVAEFFLQELLPPMPLDHHGRAIADIIPKCIEQELRGLSEYLDSRFLSTKQLRKVSRTDGKSIKRDVETEDEQYFVSACDLWPDENLLIERVLEESTSSSEVEIKMFDIPYLHNPAMDAAKELAETLSSLEDTSIFQCLAIRSIVNFRWKEAKSYVIKAQMLPYGFFFLTYLLYVFYIFPMREHADEEVQHDEEIGASKPEGHKLVHLVDFAFNALLVGFSGYFLFNEVVQIIG